MVKDYHQPSLFGAAEPLPWSDARQRKIVRIAFESGGDNLYDYALPENLAEPLAPGQRVKAPLGKGNREQVGFCVEFPPESQVEQVKTITEVVDATPLLTPEMMQLARWMAGYYCCPLGAVLSAMVPAAVKHQVGLVRRDYVRLTAAGQGQVPAPKKVSGKGQAIVLFLQEQAGQGKAELPQDEIMQALTCGKGPFTTLAKLGLIEIASKMEFPESAIGIPVVPTEHKPIELNPQQQAVFEQARKLIGEQSFQTLLLHGVTGSGKTEVYIRCIEEVVRAGRQALVLVPEIALTPQAVSRFLSRFGKVAVLHSGLSQRQRHQQWRSIALGGVDVVVGARSAVFAPLSKLGLVVVDEEHEPSYKQDSQPRYHGRDVAIKRAQLGSCAIILGSATPSLESWNNARGKRHYTLLSLPQRVLDLPLPKVHVVNMKTEMLERKGPHLLSRTLEHELKQTLAAQRQAILLLNRRGHSNYLFCPSCQFVLTCPNCDVNLTVHQKNCGLRIADCGLEEKNPKSEIRNPKLKNLGRDAQATGNRGQDAHATKIRRWCICHYCLHQSELPSACPVCSKGLIMVGPGTQKAEEELARKFPAARYLRVDSDSVKPGEYAEVLGRFGAGEIDILLGTQMIGKGLDFPGVSLVGVINADTALAIPDFRSSERTFQIIAQVAGRCGRARADGKVIVQSYLPEEMAIRRACSHDYLGFAEQELRTRERCGMPPYARMARIVMRDPKLDKLETAAVGLRQGLDQILAQRPMTLQVRGPLPCSIARIENYHRQQIILTAPGAEIIQQLLTALRPRIAEMAVQAIVDVDPINLL